VAAILAGTSAVCHGADLDYQCVITEELHLEAGGTLKRFAKPINIGERFAVDRGYWACDRRTVHALLDH